MERSQGTAPGVMVKVETGLVKYVTPLVTYFTRHQNCRVALVGSGARKL